MNISSTSCHAVTEHQTQHNSHSVEGMVLRLSAILLLCFTVLFFPSSPLYAQGTFGDTVVPIEVEQGQLPPITAQYTSSPKHVKQSYIHSEMAVNLSTVPQNRLKLIVTPEPQPSFCAPHEVLEGKIYVQFALGEDDYKFGETDFNVPFAITVTVQGYASGAPVGSPYVCSMNLGKLRPEQICQFDVTSQLGSVDYFKVSTSGYSSPNFAVDINGQGIGIDGTTVGLMHNEIRLNVSYDEMISVSPYQKNGSDPLKEDRGNPVILEITDPVGQDG